MKVLGVYSTKTNTGCFERCKGAYSALSLLPGRAAAILERLVFLDTIGFFTLC
jgi:hypothetical protein